MMMKNSEIIERINYIYEILKSTNSNSSMLLYDDLPLLVYFGLEDGKHRITIDGNEGKKTKSKSTSDIESTVYLLPNGKHRFVLNLINNSKIDILISLCTYLVLCSYSFKKTESLDAMILKWEYWLNTFKEKRDIQLTDSQLIGLIGELYFLENYMLKNYDAYKVIESWQGLENASKDFMIEETWFEVKTVDQRKDTITISSIEQLDSERSGYVVVNKYTRVNSTVSESVSLHKMISNIRSKLDITCETLFNQKLSLLVDESDSAYDKFYISINGTNFYEVNNQFPRFTRGEVNPAIASIKYDLSLRQIREFQREVLDNDNR